MTKCDTLYCEAEVVNGHHCSAGHVQTRPDASSCTCGLIPVSPEMGGVCEACEQQVPLLARGVCMDCIDSLKEAAALSGMAIVQREQRVRELLGALAWIGITMRDSDHVPWLLWCSPAPDGSDEHPTTVLDLCCSMVGCKPADLKHPHAEETEVPSDEN